MCRFKSGIILKNKIVIAEGSNESHSLLLRELGITDDYLGASKKFVRAELIPDDKEWWVNPAEKPEKWKFIVDQDIVPDWFEKESYEKLFRKKVCSWWKKHVLVDQKLETLYSGYYLLKRCEVKKLCNDVKVLLDSSQVGEMYDSSQVGKMWGASQVGEMWDASQVGKMWGASQVGEMYDSSQVGKMWGASQVGEMYNSSQVGKMWNSSQVGKMYDSSQVGEMWDASQVGKMYDSSQVGEMWDASQVGEMYNSSQVGKMWNSSQVGKMYDSSQVGEMWDASQVGKMYDSSRSIDFKEFPNIKIWCSSEGSFEMLVFKNEDNKE